MRGANAYLPLEFDAGQDAQMDWGEATVEIDGERQIVQLFLIRLNHSGPFCDGIPIPEAGSLLRGAHSGLLFLRRVPRRITYDNLKTAVYRILQGRNPQEQ